MTKKVTLYVMPSMFTIRVPCDEEEDYSNKEAIKMIKEKLTKGNIGYVYDTEPPSEDDFC